MGVEQERQDRQERKTESFHVCTRREFQVNDPNDPTEDISAGHDTPHRLYRFFDGNGALLYIGITDNLAIRWNTHRRTKTWWDDVRSMTVAVLDTRDALEAAEIAAIRAERPRHNIIHNRGDGVSFRSWLQARRAEETPIGDLARDVMADVTWPTGRSESVELYREHLEACGALWAVLDALDEAWEEYTSDANAGVPVVVDCDAPRYIGGPLHGQAVADARGRSSMYRDDRGLKISTSRGDRQFCGAAKRQHSYVRERTREGVLTYVHATVYRDWLGAGRPIRLPILAQPPHDT